MDITSAHFRKILVEMFEYLELTTVRSKITESFLEAYFVHSIANLDKNASLLLTLGDEDEYKIYQGFFEAVMFMDLYLDLNKKNALNKANSSDIKMLNRIIDCSQREESDKKYEPLFLDDKIRRSLINASIDFNESSAFSKVLAFKCLNEDDIEVLKILNPLFPQDYSIYNVKLDRDFLIRQINKWLNATGDNVVSFDEASKFIIDAFRMNIDVEDLVMDIIYFSQTNDIMQAIVDGNVDLLSSYISTYYEAYKAPTRK